MTLAGIGIGRHRHRQASASASALAAGIGIGGGHRSWNRHRRRASVSARASARASAGIGMGGHGRRLRRGHRRAWHGRAWHGRAWAQASASARRRLGLSLCMKRKKYISIPKKSKDLRLCFAVHAGDCPSVPQQERSTYEKKREKATSK